MNRLDRWLTRCGWLLIVFVILYFSIITYSGLSTS